MTPAALAGSLTLAITACTPTGEDADGHCTLAGAHAALTIQLMFGLTRPDGSHIADAEWADFLAHEVTPRFPDGLTVLQGDGQWRDRHSGRITREPSRIVWINAATSPEVSQRVDAVREAYRRLFAQQSVGLVVTPGCADF